MDHARLTMLEVTLRLLLALLCGGLIGLNRDLHHKSAGLRTFGLVALGTAGLTLAPLLALAAPYDNLGRVIQGMLTGIGFIGAGVILRRTDSGRVTGLTTAAAVWFVAGLAVLSGLGLYALVWVLLALGLALLLAGRRLEIACERIFNRYGDDGPGAAGGRSP